MPPFWDFDEYTNYISININGNEYKVLDKQDSYEAAVLLYYIDMFIASRIVNLSQSIHKFPKKVKNGLDIFLNTPYYCQEMQINTKLFPVPFEGLNKPKNIRHYKDSPSVGADKKLRAEHRAIFFKLRYNNGNLKPFSKLKPLVLHEITHTACNHVKWRDDDHNKDFQEYEKILKSL